VNKLKIVNHDMLVKLKCLSALNKSWNFIGLPKQNIPNPYRVGKQTNVMNCMSVYTYFLLWNLNEVVEVIIVIVHTLFTVFISVKLCQLEWT